MKGQMTVINAVLILISLLFIVFVAGLFFPILDNVLLPNFTSGDMNYNLSLIIFPTILIGLIAIIWLWARPMM